MIIANGTVRFKYKCGGGLDERGYPVKAAAIWGDPVPCQYVAKAVDLTARSAESPTASRSYEIYLDLPLPDYTEQLKLTDEGGGELGEYSVQSAETLRAVQQGKITV